MDVRRVVYGLDELNIQGRLEEGAKHLEYWLGEARAERDEKSELTILSEMLGQYRKCGMAEKGLKACEEAISLLERLSYENTATGATILLNAATAYDVFGQSEKALEIFRRCEAVYSSVLDENDYRMAGLYNNEASAFMNLGDYASAEERYLSALDILSHVGNSRCDRAATWCALASLYELTGKDAADIDGCLEKAYDLFIEESESDSPYLLLTLSECIGAFEHFGKMEMSANLSKIKEKLDGIFR